MGSVETHTCHTWDGPNSGDNLSKMQEVYSGPVHIQPIELVYPVQLQKDVRCYGEEWVKAVGANPSINVATLQNFRGHVVKCPQDMNHHINDGAKPASMLELMSLFPAKKEPKQQKLKINTLSEALAHGIQIRSTNFDPGMVTQIRTNEPISKRQYQFENDSCITTVAGVYVNGNSHAVLPGKLDRQAKSKSCLDSTWNAYPSTQTAGLIMKSNVTHVVPVSGGALLMLADGCRFPSQSQFKMSSNCFPEVLNSQ